MRTIERPSAFKRDFKRESKGRHRDTLNEVLREVLQLLVTDRPLPPKNRDHDLIGNWVGYRECHLKPDLLLIYKKIGSDRLVLARLGSHGKLFS